MYQFAADVLLAVKNRFDSRPQFTSGICLQDVSPRSSTQSRLYHIGIIVESANSTFSLSQIGLCWLLSEVCGNP